MSYSIETYDKAQSILDRRKEKATLEAQDRADELCAKIPELNTINRKLAQIGLNISKTFFASQNPKEDIDRLRTESLALQEEKKNLLKIRRKCTCNKIYLPCVRGYRLHRRQKVQMLY